MKSRILGVALFGLTLAAVTYYPQLMAKSVSVQPPAQPPVAVRQNAKVDVVFVLDTTGSMSGLIQTAKEKIWSIATTMASAQQTPDIRIGLVAYRDRGDSYVTKVVDLSGDLDSVYATLMDFEADGGGDGPESVNKALYDAVHGISWTQDDRAYRVIFLVGDAPPHMDYNEVQYPEIAASARDKGIVINTVQCGDIPTTVGPWAQIAGLGKGEFFQVEQAGGAVAFTTPFDDEIAELSARLDDTRMYYGTGEEKARMREKVAATEKLTAGSTPASLARRGVFNASESGRSNLAGDNELLDALASGKVELGELAPEALPEVMRPMAPEEQKDFVARVTEEREDLKRQIQVLAEKRDGFLSEKVEQAGGLESSLDEQIYRTIREQGGEAGLDYDDGPSY